MPLRIRWTWLVGAAAVAVLVLAVLAAPLADFLEWVEGILPGQGLRAIVLYALIYALGPLLLLPAAPFSFGAGIIFGLPRGFVAAMLGSVLTASAGFLLSRYLFRRRLERGLRSRPKYAALDRMVTREGWKIVALLRLTWLHCGLSNYAYGLTAIPFPRYIVVSAIALMPGNLISVYLGAVGAIGYDAMMSGTTLVSPLEYLMLGLGAAAGVAVAVLMSVKAKKALEQVAARSGEAPPTDP